MNEKAHWDKIAGRYEDEIFDVFQSDKKKKLPAYFRKHAHADHVAIDFGCGVGKAFPYLSPMFRRVIGTDISRECLAFAKTRPYSNISFKRADLTRTGLKLGQAEFGFCCNVVMLPEIEKNLAMLKNIHRSLKPGGTALLVVPSLESILYSTSRMLQWYRKEGVKAKHVPIQELSYYRGTRRHIAEGVIYIDGVPTKHYLEAELRALMAEARFSITTIDRIEYDWSSEFADPPRWMGEPWPWDWVVELKVKN